VLVNPTKLVRELYERIVAKGKSEKLVLIAIANKPMKQAFAIAKPGLIYDPEFRGLKLN
jgi:transposase